MNRGPAGWWVLSRQSFYNLGIRGESVAQQMSRRVSKRYSPNAFSGQWFGTTAGRLRVFLPPVCSFSPSSSAWIASQRAPARSMILPAGVGFSTV